MLSGNCHLAVESCNYNPEIQRIIAAFSLVLLTLLYDDYYSNNFKYQKESNLNRCPLPYKDPGDELIIIILIIIYNLPLVCNIHP